MYPSGFLEYDGSSWVVKDIPTLESLGYTPPSLTDLGYTVPTLTDLSYTLPTLADLGYTPLTLADLGYTPPTLADLGYTVPTLEDLGYTEPSTIKGDDEDTGRGILSISQNDTALTINYTDILNPNTFAISTIKGDDGTDGQGITSIELTSDNRLQINYNSGTPQETTDPSTITRRN